jgi:GrpB-like predicted nucleotidyltransferase (UPF0157 family)
MDEDLAVEVVPYDSEAPRIFEEIKRSLCNLIPYQIQVEHVGSTAVPGLGGKGIIDILIVTKPEHMQRIVELLESQGYKHNPEAGNAERLFVSGPYRYRDKELHIHLHITFFGSKEHKDKLLFRDYLRKNPEEARRYYKLKKRWSKEAGPDPSKYTELKTSYINEVLEKARKEKKIKEIKRYRRKWYDERASIYDKLWWESEEAKEEMEGFKKLVKVKGGEVVLDVATGTGVFLIEMAKDGAPCYGIDASPKMLEQLKRKIKQQRLEGNVKEIRVGEADKLPYQDNFFDWVTCMGMLEYYPIEYAEVVLGEIKRVLKPGKKCFMDIVDPANPEAQSRDYLYKYDLKAFEEMLNRIGFKILKKNVAGRMIQYLLLKPN